MDEQKDAPRMSAEQSTKALDAAYSAHVARLYGDLVAAGDADGPAYTAAREKFVNSVRSAQRAHDDAVADLAKSPESATESDEEYRARMLPIAGDDARRKAIEDAKGDALDKLGIRYNVERSRVVRDRSGQKQAASLRGDSKEGADKADSIENPKAAQPA